MKDTREVGEPELADAAGAPVVACFVSADSKRMREGGMVREESKSCKFDRMQHFEFFFCFALLWKG